MYMSYGCVPGRGCYGCVPGGGGVLWVCAWGVVLRVFAGGGEGVYGCHEGLMQVNNIFY